MHLERFPSKTCNCPDDKVSGFRIKNHNDGCVMRSRVTSESEMKEMINAFKEG